MRDVDPGARRRVCEASQVLPVSMWVRQACGCLVSPGNSEGQPGLRGLPCSWPSPPPMGLPAHPAGSARRGRPIPAPAADPPGACGHRVTLRSIPGTTQSHRRRPGESCSGGRGKPQRLASRPGSSSLPCLCSRPQVLCHRCRFQKMLDHREAQGGTHRLPPPAPRCPV